MLSLSLKLFLIALNVAHTLSHNSHSDSWYHPQDHPIHDMFKRAVTPNNDTQALPKAGSNEWKALFPSPQTITIPDTSLVPKFWVDKLNAAVAAKKIPDIPPSNASVYPPGVDPISAEVCSGTYKCIIPGDIWEGPDGVFASSFDDGPTLFTPNLLSFLASKNVSTTHFMIGYNMLIHLPQFLDIMNAGDDIAVHTWSHPYMTGLSNMQIVAELYFTMLMIYVTTGHVPVYWRPPFGDTDTRVSAIAKQVFFLTTVVWNNDTTDWNETSDATNIVNTMEKFLAGPKEPGLIVLEHELTNFTLEGFFGAFPSIAKNGWKFMSLAVALGIKANPGNFSQTDLLPKPTVSPVSPVSSTTPR